MYCVCSVEDPGPACSCVADAARIEPRRGIDAALAERLEALAPSLAYKVSALAAALHISERQLRRLTRAAFGVSPNRWLRRRRMAAVLERLSQARSVKEVAFDFGHSNVSQFSRDFKSQFGCTPSSVLGQPDKLRALATTLIDS